MKVLSFTSKGNSYSRYSIFEHTAQCTREETTSCRKEATRRYTGGSPASALGLNSTRLMRLTASRELPDPRVRLQAICTGGLGARTPVASGEAQRGGGGQALGPIAAREIAVGKSGFDEFWRVYGPVPSPERVPTASEKAAGASAPAPVPALAPGPGLATGLVLGLYLGLHPGLAPRLPPGLAPGSGVAPGFATARRGW